MKKATEIKKLLESGLGRRDVEDMGYRPSLVAKLAGKTRTIKPTGAKSKLSREKKQVEPKKGGKPAPAPAPAKVEKKPKQLRK